VLRQAVSRQAWPDANGGGASPPARPRPAWRARRPAPPAAAPGRHRRCCCPFRGSVGPMAVRASYRYPAETARGRQPRSPGVASRDRQESVAAHGSGGSAGLGSACAASAGLGGTVVHALAARGGLGAGCRVPGAGRRGAGVGLGAEVPVVAGRGAGARRAWRPAPGAVGERWSPPSRGLAPRPAARMTLTCEPDGSECDGIVSGGCEPRPRPARHEWSMLSAWRDPGVGPGRVRYPDRTGGRRRPSPWGPPSGRWRRVWLADRRPPTADRRPPTADRRPPTADRRPPTGGHGVTATGPPAPGRSLAPALMWVPAGPSMTALTWVMGGPMSTWPRSTNRAGGGAERLRTAPPSPKPRAPVSAPPRLSVVGS